MSLNFEDKLNVDLEFFKMNISIDVHFIMYLESLNIENLKIISYDSDYNKVVKENRRNTQYITFHEDIKTTKKICWFIPWTLYSKDYYAILAEIQWIKNDDTALTVKIWGEKALNLLKPLIKKWAEEHEYFVTLDVLNAQNNCYYVAENWKKYVWQDKYTLVKTEK